MVDIHSHILPSIDDGAQSIDESINIIKKAQAAGVTDIIVTPHFILGSDYDANNEKKRKLLTKLKKKIKDENIDINLYLGNEVFIENDLLKLRQDKLITTLNNSKYLLFELPMNGKYSGLLDIVFHLSCKGYTCIIAHPERYASFKKNPRIVEKLIDQGVLFQCNISSFLGYYGKEAQKLALLLLKHHAITFLASDIHREKSEHYNNINKVRKVLKKYISKDEIDDLFINNGKKVINKEKITMNSIKPFKKSFFGSWK